MPGGRTTAVAVVALCCGLYWSAIALTAGSLVAVLITHILWT